MAEKLLQRFLDIQERRAAIYATLHSGFVEYLRSSAEIAYKDLCNKVTVEFNDCSREVIEIEAALRDPACSRADLADLLQAVQSHERNKLRMTATLQILKRAGHPSERKDQTQTLASAAPDRSCNICSKDLDCDGDSVSGLEECQAEAEYQSALKEAVTSLQEAILSINDLVETVRSELDDDDDD